MKTIKDKELLVAADIAGFELKEAIVKHLEAKGWKITDIGVRSADDPPGMGIHIAASKCPHVHAAVVESVMSAKRAITGNNVNVLAMGGHWIGHNMGIEIAEAYLSLSMGQGYEWWPNFYEFHKLAYDELEAFNYEEFKANGFKLKHLGEVDLPGCAKPNDVE